MGQYYLLVNLTTGQYLHPHALGGGAKLMEIAYSTEGLMTALAVLLASGNGRGDGDIRTGHPVVGSWAGHRVVLAGDYDDEGRHCTELLQALGLPCDEENPPTSTLYCLARDVGIDISSEVHACFASAGESLGGSAWLER